MDACVFTHRLWFLFPQTLRWTQNGLVVECLLLLGGSGFGSVRFCCLYLFKIFLKYFFLTKNPKKRVFFFFLEQKKRLFYFILFYHELCHFCSIWILNSSWEFDRFGLKKKKKSDKAFFFCAVFLFFIYSFKKLNQDI